MYDAILKALLETLYMVSASTLLASLLGIPLGVLLKTTQPGHLFPAPMTHRILSFVMNCGRSLPFIILLIAILPFTRWLIGTSIGNNAAIVALTISATPFLAQVVQTALSEVPTGLLEMGRGLGARPISQIRYILLPEAMPGIIEGITLTAISLVGYSAMAGTVGGGGLGSLAIHYGYHRFDTQVMLSTVIILIALVQAIQALGNLLARRLARR